MATDDLTRIEGWLSGITGSLKPGARVRLARKIGESLRRSNAKRIAVNREPDGSAMEARKPRDGRGKIKRRAKMFPRIRLAKHMRVKPDQDGVSLTFGAAGNVAAIHHFGEVGSVGKTKDGRTIRTRYAARRLLGFGPDDMEMVLDDVVKHLGR